LNRPLLRVVLTSNIARFYLALNLHRYDQQYEKALGVLVPLVGKVPTKSALSTGARDLCAKTWSKSKQALACIAPRAAAVQNVECQSHLRELVRASIAALGPQ